MIESRPVNQREFRTTMGLFATGVAVLTVYTDDGSWLGMTANAITSVSLEPLLVLVCVEKRASIVEPLLKASGFTLSILNDQQRDLSTYFAGFWESETPPPFAVDDWPGGPRLKGCLGAVNLTRSETLEGGDHWIVMGEVRGLYRSASAARPLIFFRGGYWSTATSEE